MDPTAELCRIRDSFASRDYPPLPTGVALDDETRALPLVEAIEVAPVGEEDLVHVTDPDRVYTLELRLAEIRMPLQREGRYDRVRDAANPFENIGDSVFMNRAAVKLADLDALYDLMNLESTATSGSGVSYLNRHIYVQDDTFKALDIAGGPGGFVEYLQYRRPSSRVFGTTLKSPDPSLNWNMCRIDSRGFTDLGGSGNLYTDTEWLITEMNRRSPTGVDLVTADGGFEEDFGRTRFGQSALNTQSDEVDKRRLITAEWLLGLSALRPGGNMVVKHYQSHTRYSGDLLYLVAVAFEAMTVVKPVTSRPANTECYVVAVGYRPREGESVRRILLRAYKSFGESTAPRSLLASVPTPFLEWLRQRNDELLTLREQAVGLIESARSGTVRHEYDLHRALIYWNLPGNADTEDDKTYCRT